MQEIIDIAHRMAVDKFNCQSGGYISKRTQLGMFITSENADLDNLADSDILDVSRSANMPKEFATHAAIYQAMPQVNVIMHLMPYFTTQMSIHNVSPYAYLEDYAEVMGKRLAMSTTVPSRVVDTIVKHGSAMLLNKGIMIVGKSIEGTYAKARLIERAAFTYLALKLLDMENESLQLPSKEIHSSRIKYLKNRDASPLPLTYTQRDADKMYATLVKLAPDLEPIMVEAPIFGGILAAGKISLSDEMPFTEYGALRGKKNKLAFISKLKQDDVVVVRGKGIYCSNIDREQAIAAIADFEGRCRDYIIAQLSYKYGADNVEKTSRLMELFITKEVK